MELERRADALEARIVLASVVLRRRLGRHTRDVLLVIAAVFVALLLAEGALRLYLYVRTTQELAKMGSASPTTHIDTDVGQLAAGARLTALPGMLYELRPNLRGVYDGHRYASDRYGFREDAPMTVTKPPGTRRIVGIGDSWMWGTGVDNGELYLDRLREMLGVEVVNTGVWGYNARQQVATLRWKGLLFSPDVVVVGLCGNDREYPTFLSRQPYGKVGSSFLWNELSRRLFGWSKRPADNSMPFSEFMDAYAELAGLAKTNGFRVVVFSECFGAGDSQTEHPSCRLGDAGEWRRFLARLDEWGFHRCPWDIERIPQNAGRVGHATAEGNGMLASVLAECVKPLLR
jgi:hypothetical protein